MTRNTKPRIATLCVEGRDLKGETDTKAHLALLEEAVETLEANPQWAPVDALLLPGGFLFENNAKAEAIMAGSQAALQRSVLGKVADLAKRLDKWSPGIQIVTGVDTSNYTAHGQKIGGHQLAMAFNKSGLSGYARKIFLIGEDYDGKLAPPMMTRERDFNDEHRIIELAGGGKALLCVCYDTFGIGDAARNHPQRLNSTVKIEDRKGVLREGRGKQETVRRGFSAFRDFLKASQPGAAMAVIHRFKKSGAENFYQRHGIACASAGLGGGLAIAATHAAELPEDPQKMCLAATGVGPDHLEARGHRHPHAQTAQDFRRLSGKEGKTAGLLRLYAP